MTPYYADDWLTVYLGDCREVMAAMPAESVHCVVTSPPYWGLRDYGTATWEGGGYLCRGDHPLTADVDWWSKSTDEIRAELEAEAAEERDLNGCPTCGSPRCDHKIERPRRKFTNGRGEGVDDEYAGSNLSSWTTRDGSPVSPCPRCGAIRQDGQLGLEPTPELFVEAMVAVFREVRRVLRKDGTVWLNLGDSYAGGGGFAPDAPSNKAGAKQTTMRGAPGARGLPVTSGLKPKDLVGIPWRVAFALQADGWYLRSDIIWSKPNPMPESVTDRPTKAHEYVFLLSKSPRYYYDSDAVREAVQEWNTPTGRENAAGIESPRAVVREELGALKGGRGYKVAYNNPAGRNLRSVWNIATEPYPGAHFATFPRALVEPCIKAGTSEKGVCPECGAPWVREVERTRTLDGEPGPTGGFPLDEAGRLGAQGVGHWRFATLSATLGWRPSCVAGQCPAADRPSGDWPDMAPIPATVLDPFAGSGTTGLVAQSLSRRAVLIDLSADYLEQLMDRNRDIPLGLAGG